MAEMKARWTQMTDSATQATRQVVERTQVFAQKIETGVRKEALADVKRARAVVKKADQGLTNLPNRNAPWAETQPKSGAGKAVKAGPAVGESVAKTKAPTQSVTSQAS